MISISVECFEYYEAILEEYYKISWHHNSGIKARNLRWECYYRKVFVIAIQTSDQLDGVLKMLKAKVTMIVLWIMSTVTAV